jgi:hypothetical protein
MHGLDWPWIIGPRLDLDLDRRLERVRHAVAAESDLLVLEELPEEGANRCVNVAR